MHLIYRQLKALPVKKKVIEAVSNICKYGMIVIVGLKLINNVNCLLQLVLLECQ